MLHLLHIVLRVLAGIAGAVAMYAARFLYEDEQGRIENRLEEWWVRLDDQRNAAVSRHTAFMREVARFEDRGFDKVFGHKLFSVEAFGASSALSALSMLAFGSLLVSLTGRPVVGTLLLIFTLLLGMITFVGSRRSLGRLFIPFAVVFVGSAVTGVTHGSLYPVVLLAAIIVSFISDMLFIAMTRWILRRSASLRQFAAIIGLVTLNVFLATLLSVVPYLLVAYSREMFGRMTSALVIIFNLLDSLIASIFILLAVVLLAHRLFWPLVSRPLYALRERGLRSKAFYTVGSALIGYAAAGERVWRFLDKLIG
jgi:hypothetical protein